MSHSSAVEADVLENQRRDLAEFPTDETPLLQEQNDEIEVIDEKPPSLFRRFLGFFLVFLSSLSFSVMGAIVHQGTKTMPSMEIVWCRQLFQTVFSGAVLAYQGINPTKPRESFPWVLARGFLGSLAQACSFYSLSRLPLGTSSVIFFTFPIFTGFFAFVLLRERYTITLVVASILSLVGVALVSQPPFIFGSTGDQHFNDHWDGYLSALAGAVVCALSLVSVKKAGKVGFMNFIFWFGAIGSIYSPFLLFFAEKPVVPSGWDWGILAGVCLFGVLGQCMLVKGVQLEKAGPTQLLRNLDIVFAFLFQALLFHEKISKWAFIGTAIIICCSIAIVLEKFFTGRKKKD